MKFTMNVKMIVTAVAAIVTAAGMNTAQAQDHHQQHQPRVQQQQTQQYQQLIVTPKLGIHAIQGPGNVEITSVQFNTPAQRMGLEAGDRILQVNGHQVHSVADLQRLLQDAVQFHNGQVRLLVDNVRARHGQGQVNRYVSVGTWLDGYGGLSDNHNPTPVPVYTAQQ